MFLRELRYAVRSLARRPGFLASATLTLAAGIGAATALFSVIDAVLLRPLPYRDPEGLVTVSETKDGGATLDAAGPANLLDWRRASTQLDGIAAWWIESTTLLGDGRSETEEVPSARVTADFFPVLGVEPILGRVFTEPEVRRQERVAVLSHELWQTHYASDAAVLGADIPTKDGAFRILGVMPESFRVPGTLPGEALLFKPWDFERHYAHLPQVPRDHRFLRTAARIGRTVTIEEAQAELDAVAAALAEAYPDTNHGWGVRLVPLRDALVGDAQGALWLLLGAVGFLLLLACANVTGLLLVRASGRTREIALRRALGASRARIVRQLSLESLFIAGLGGAFGALLAGASTGLLLRAAPAGLLGIDAVRVDGRALLFAIGVSAVAGFVAGLVPAFQGSASAVAESLKSATGAVSAGGARQRLRSAIVTVEVAAAVLLLVASGLFLRSLSRVNAVDPGFDPSNLLVVRMRLDAATYGGGGAHPYYTELLERLRALPGVVSAGGTTALEMDELDVDFDRPFWKEGEPRPAGGGPGVQIRMPTTGYFETMRIPLVAGRMFDGRDDRTKPRVLVVNEIMARRTWPQESPLGTRIFIDYQGYAAPYEVVGVVGDTRFYGHKNEPRPAVYIPHAQNPYLPLNIVLRTRGEPSALAPAVRGEVLDLDPSQPVHSMRTMEGLMGAYLGPDRFSAQLLTLFAGIALVLASIGLYGVVAYSVSERRGELGLRMALGADPRDIVTLVLRGGLGVALAGTSIGILGAMVAGRWLGAMLFEVSPTDPATLALAGTVAVVTVIAASYYPARRAAQIDPTESLRAE